MAVFAPSPAPLIATIVMALLSIIIFLPLLYWIPRYYDSILYMIDNNEISWKRGVWFKNTGIVPYEKVTNVDIGQGPLSRRVGLSSVKVQTAGYSATSGSKAELCISGIEKDEGLRDMIISQIRSRRAQTPRSTSTEVTSTEEKILSELRAIRALMEKG